MKSKQLYWNFRIAFQTKCKLSNVFTVNNKIPFFLPFKINYKFQSGGQNGGNVSTTLKPDYITTSNVLFSLVKTDNSAHLIQHLLFCNYLSDFKDFSILASSNMTLKLASRESHYRQGSPFTLDNKGNKVYNRLYYSSDCSLRMKVVSAETLGT